MTKTISDINSVLRDWSVRFRIIREPYDKLPFGDCMDVFRRCGEMICPHFVIDEANRWTLENLVRWVNADPSAECLDARGRVVKADLLKGIYLAGPTGTGKTLALRALNIYACTVGISYIDAGAWKTMSWEPKRADAICEEYAQSGDLYGFKRKGILCIHDLCSEAPETLYMGNRRNVMQTVLESRADSTNLFTLVTSNQGIDRLAGFYGDRVQSRAYQMFNYYTLVGADRRAQR